MTEGRKDTKRKEGTWRRKGGKRYTKKGRKEGRREGRTEGRKDT